KVAVHLFPSDLFTIIREPPLRKSPLLAIAPFGKYPHLCTEQIIQPFALFVLLMFVCAKPPGFSKAGRFFWGG
ncbi:hypothetical protein, partial [Alistipes finegoldii]|uniref:hypothetical protein n=1 Tax=Alistipes finegoldii TaxID=214856 RepID=UPI003AB52D91